jgi:hypothetical protein
VLVSALLRVTEGIGTAFLTTAIFSTFPKLFPKHVGTLVVGLWLKYYCGNSKRISHFRGCLNWVLRLVMPLDLQLEEYYIRFVLMYVVQQTRKTSYMGATSRFIPPSRSFHHCSTLHLSTAYDCVTSYCIECFSMEDTDFHFLLSVG